MERITKLLNLSCASSELITASMPDDETWGY